MHSYTSRLRSRLRKRLETWGFELRRRAPHDLRGREESPRDLILGEPPLLWRSVLVDVPLPRCRSLLGRTFSASSHHYVAALNGGPLLSYSGSVLEAYYQQCQPSTASDVLGVHSDDAPGFSTLPAFAYVVPWEGTDPEEMITKRRSWMAADARQFDQQLTLHDGFAAFGPVTPAKGSLEVERLNVLYESIAARGFKRHDSSDGDVEGRLLTDGSGRWAVKIGRGQHRVAVAAALGMTSVPVRVTSLPVKREEARYWPQVVDGRISPGGAQSVFDRMMRGEPPPSCHYSIAGPESTNSSPRAHNSTVSASPPRV